MVLVYDGDAARKKDESYNRRIENDTKYSCRVSVRFVLVRQLSWQAIQRFNATDTSQ